MNGSPAASYAQMKSGSLAGPDFSAFKQVAAHTGPTTAGAGAQEGNIGSTQYVFETGQLNPGKPQSYSSATSTSLYGARESRAPMPPGPMEG